MSLTKSRNIAQLRLQMLTHVLVLISHCVLSLIVVVMLYFCLLMTLSTCRASTEGEEPIKMMDSDSEVSLTILTILTKQLPWDTCLSKI